MFLEMHCFDEATPPTAQRPISAQQTQTADSPDSLCYSLSKQAAPDVLRALVLNIIYLKLMKKSSVAEFFSAYVI